MSGVTLERLHEIADAFARRDVDGSVNAFWSSGRRRPLLQETLCNDSLPIDTQRYRFAKEAP